MAKKTAKNKVGIWILAIVLYTILAQIIHSIFAMLTMDYYMNPAYAMVWSKVMMPGFGPPPVSFCVYSIIFGLITALLFVFVFDMVRNSLKGRTKVLTGIHYGFIVCLLTAIPTLFMLILLINLPFSLLIVWFIEYVIIFVGGGVIVSLLMK